MRYAIYDEAGRLLQIRQEPNEIIACDEGVDTDTHYVDLAGDVPEIKERAPLDLQFEVSGLEVTFSRIPAGTRVYANSHLLVSDEEGVSFEFDEPGEKTLLFFPPVEWRDAEMEVTVG